MFDPTIPATNAEATSAMFRGQFQGLKALIDAVSGVTSAVVDSVTTLSPGSPAVVSVSVSSGTLHLSFELPRGNDGPTGAPGTNGSDGAQGPQGPPFANAVVDGVTTLNPGEPATVGVAFDGSNVRFNFGLPRGNDGAMGLPGEVSQVDLNNAQLNTLSQTSNNTNAVATLGLSVSDPPSQSELQNVANKLDELIQALRR
jgi:hypothetical protein